ncbi:hypothetical protein [Streptomyces aidingensis]|nr:hypothetical protein [Streptomyces aidingensis]
MTVDPMRPSSMPDRQPSRRGAGPLIAAAAGGLVLGAAGVGVAWALGDSGGGPLDAGGGAEADARDACEVLARFDEERFFDEDDAGRIASYRFGLVVGLAEAAAVGDAEYEPLAEAMRTAQAGIANAGDLDGEAGQALADAREFCDGR